MKMKSPTETPIYIGLTSGHTCTIGPDYAEVDARFQRQAVVEGAIPEGLEHLQVPPETVETNKATLILAALRTLVATPQAGDFAHDGKPVLLRLSERVGFTISRQQRDSAWKALSDELDAKEAQ